MADNSVQNILNKLGIEDTGRYDNHFYIIELESSDEYAKMYTKLTRNAINTEFPTFGTNTSDSTVKITNYFETEEDNITYRIFLIADFDNEKYYLKLGGF
jgi:hypothetical protein